jgi:DNA-binding transcriptional ArsR family regulator
VRGWSNVLEWWKTFGSHPSPHDVTGHFVPWGLRVNTSNLPKWESRAQLERMTNLFKGLADENRLRILQFLAEVPEMNVTQIAESMKQSQPAVSHHLHQLRIAGLIEFRRAGKFNFYRISDSGLRELFDLLFPSSPSGAFVIGGVEFTLVPSSSSPRR